MTKATRRDELLSLCQKAGLSENDVRFLAEIETTATAKATPAQTTSSEAMKDFIISKGLWSEYVHSLPRLRGLQEDSGHG